MTQIHCHVLNNKPANCSILNSIQNNATTAEKIEFVLKSESCFGSNQKVLEVLRSLLPPIKEDKVYLNGMRQLLGSSPSARSVIFERLEEHNTGPYKAWATLIQDGQPVKIEKVNDWQTVSLALRCPKVPYYLHTKEQIEIQAWFASIDCPEKKQLVTLMLEKTLPDIFHGYTSTFITSRFGTLIKIATDIKKHIAKKVEKFNKQHTKKVALWKNDGEWSIEIKYYACHKSNIKRNSDFYAKYIVETDKCPYSNNNEDIAEDLFTKMTVENIPEYLKHVHKEFLKENLIGSHYLEKQMQNFNRNETSDQIVYFKSNSSKYAHTYEISTWNNVELILSSSKWKVSEILSYFYRRLHFEIGDFTITASEMKVVASAEICRWTEKIISRIWKPLFLIFDENGNSFTSVCDTKTPRRFVLQHINENNANYILEEFQDVFQYSTPARLYLQRFLQDLNKKSDYFFWYLPECTLDFSCDWESPVTLSKISFEKFYFETIRLNSRLTAAILKDFSTKSYSLSYYVSQYKISYAEKFIKKISKSIGIKVIQVKNGFQPVFKMGENVVEIIESETGASFGSSPKLSCNFVSKKGDVKCSLIKN